MHGKYYLPYQIGYVVSIAVVAVAYATDILPITKYFIILELLRSYVHSTQLGESHHGLTLKT